MGESGNEGNDQLKPGEVVLLHFPGDSAVRVLERSVISCTGSLLGPLRWDARAVVQEPGVETSCLFFCSIHCIHFFCGSEQRERVRQFFGWEERKNALRGITANPIGPRAHLSDGQRVGVG